MISIVNKTTWLNPNANPSLGLPINVTIPSGTAGNTMILFLLSQPGDSAGLLGTYKMGAEQFTNGGVSEGSVIKYYYINNILGGETTLTITVAAAGALALFETTPITLQSLSAVGTQSPSVSQISPAVTGTGNCVYFCVNGQGISGETPTPNSYASVSSPYSLSVALNGIYTSTIVEMGIGVLLNATGTQQPTFTLTSSTVPNVPWNSMHLAFQDAGGGPGPPMAPQVPTAWMRHMMVNLAWPAENQPNELLSYSIYGSVHTEG